MASAEDHYTAALAMWNIYATAPGQLGTRTPAEWLAGIQAQALMAIAVEMGVPPTGVNVEMPTLAIVPPAAEQPASPGG